MHRARTTDALPKVVPREMRRIQEEPTDTSSSLERLAHRVKLLEDCARLAHVGGWEWDVASDELLWSDEMYRIHGIEPADFGRTLGAFLQRVHEDDLEKARAVLVAAVKTGAPFTFDHRIVRPDGEVRILQTRGETIVSITGKTERLYGSCWDVTELRRAAEEREHALSLLRATLDATADGTLVIDRTGKIVAYNDRFVSLWHLPPDLVTRGADQVLLEAVVDQLSDPTAFLARVEEVYQDPSVESFDVVHFKDGRVFERYSRPQRLGDQVVGRVWSFRDVTERALRLSGALFLSDAARCLASLDSDRALEAIVRLAVAYLCDACAIDLFAPPDGRHFVASSTPDVTLAAGVQEGARGGRSVLYRSGEVAHLAVPLRSRGAIIGAVTFASITRTTFDKADVAIAEELASRICQALESADRLREAQEALRAREEFIAIAAHEIRGPITTMHLAAQLLRKGNLESDAADKALEALEREDRRLSRFIDELLDVGRARTGGLHFVLEKVNLADVVRSIARKHTTELARCGSPLSLKLDERAFGLWDRLRVEQVVTNLLTNAIKFANGTPIDISVSLLDERARLEVRDRGIGISKEAQARIFDAFERIDPARKYGGLGLGLYIVRMIVEGLGGTVSVDSEPGHGARFVVELPTGHGDRPPA